MSICSYLNEDLRAIANTRTVGHHQRVSHASYDRSYFEWFLEMTGPSVRTVRRNEIAMAAQRLCTSVVDRYCIGRHRFYRSGLHTVNCVRFPPWSADTLSYRHATYSMTALPTKHIRQWLMELFERFTSSYVLARTEKQMCCPCRARTF